MTNPAESPVIGKATLGSRFKQYSPYISIIAIVALIWCFWIRKPPPPPPVSMGMACPHSWEGVDSFPASGILEVTPQTTDIPEFHDCQRFVFYNGTTKRYGPIYAIFARQGIENINLVTPLTDANVKLTIGSSGTKVQDGGTGSGSTTTKTKAGSGSAVIETFGVIYADSDYSELGLKRRFNCLRLQRMGDALTALMVPVGGHSEACVSSSALATYQSNPGNYQATSATPLKVAYTTLPDVPAVARWDWDSHNNVQTIGILCPGGWCTVYKMDAPTIAEAPGGNLGSSTFATHLVMVKGWYDEQPLLHLASGQMKVGDQFVSVYPDPSLITRKQFSDFKKGTWYASAYVVMHADDPDYATKFGFHKTPAGGPSLTAPATINTISLCSEHDGTSAADPATPNCAAQLLGTGPQSCSSLIYAKVDYPGQTSRYFCVNYRTNKFGITAYGTARWHWRDDDDTVWVSCPMGCCEVLVDGDGRGT